MLVSSVSHVHGEPLFLISSQGVRAWGSLGSTVSHTRPRALAVQLHSRLIKMGCIIPARVRVSLHPAVPNACLDPATAAETEEAG